MKRIHLLVLVLLLGVLNTTGQNFKFLPDAKSQFITGSTIRSSAATSWSPAVEVPITEVDEWSYIASHSSTWSDQFQYKSARDVIRLKVNNSDAFVVPAYKYRVSLLVYKYTPASPTTPSSTESVTLYLSYDPSSLTHYNDQSVYSFSDCYRYQAKIVDIKAKTTPTGDYTTPVAPSEVAKNFFLETEIITQRYDKFTTYLNTEGYLPYSGAPFLNVSAFHTLLPYTGGTITATPLVKPAAYELEWTYLDDYQYNLTTNSKSFVFPSASTIAYDFRKNSTRVQMDFPQYSIPLIYEHGAVIFRFRMLRPKFSNYAEIEYGPWTLPDNGTISTGSDFYRYGTLINKPHTDDSLNWQYTINFAEQGKYKHVINYFDGSLKDRQTQTKINSDPTNVVAVEKVYDYEGRPGVVSLPTPVPQPGLYFRKDILTNDATGKAYKAADFDMLGCSRPGAISALHSSAAANIYYSPLNPDKTGMQRFVPDAEGYPMVQTVYSPDNTNKVSWQGGAGKEQQLSKGHGTQYEYIRALQPELDKYLGMEAGNYRYYPKQIVTDPNGQSSYSILNPEGKVMISGLQGESPAQLQQLPNFVAGEAVCSDILKNEQQEKLNNGLQASTSVYNDAAGNNTLSYSVKTKPFAPGCSGQYLWTQGKYDVTVTDDCGQKYAALSTAGAVGSEAVTSSPGSPGYSIAVTDPVLSATMPKGKLMIDKTLTFSPYDIRNQVSGFVKSNEPLCYKPEEHFVRMAVERTEFPCSAPSGEDAVDDCSGLEQEMMNELFPRAKYGKYAANDDGSFKDQVDNSIFTIVSQKVPLATGETETNMIGSTEQCDIPHCSTSSCSGETTGCGCADGAHSYLSPCCSECLLNRCKCIIFPTRKSTASTKGTVVVVKPCIVTPLSTYEESAITGGYVASVHSVSPLPAGATGVFAQWKTYTLYGGCTCPGAPLHLINRMVFRRFPYTAHYDGWVCVVNENPAIVPHECEQEEETEIASHPEYASGVDIFYRYQSDCITYPDVQHNGRLYTGAEIRRMTPQDFMQIFNKDIARALLPLHPEYCRLMLCKATSGTFEKDFGSIATFNEAEAKGLFTLDDIVSKDPYPVYFAGSGGSALAAMRNVMKYPYKEEYARTPPSAITPANLLEDRLDKQSLAQTYCGAGNAEEMAVCAEVNYKSQISTPVFETDDIKQRYFETLQARYLGNRNMIKQLYLDYWNADKSCGPCALFRMKLVKPKVFDGMHAYSGIGTDMTFGPDEDFDRITSWRKRLYNKGTVDVADKIAEDYEEEKYKMADIEIEGVLNALNNCGLSVSAKGAISFTLRELVRNGGRITPDVIKESIVAAMGPGAINDLCHPFLVSYGLYPDEQKAKMTAAPFICDDAIQTGLASFMSRTDVVNALRCELLAPHYLGTISPTITLNLSNPFEKKLQQFFDPTETMTTVTVQSMLLQDWPLPSPAPPGPLHLKVTQLKINPAFGYGSGSVSLNMVPVNSGGTLISALDPTISGHSSTLTVNGVSCINDERSAAYAGKIAQKTAVLDVTCTGCATHEKYFIWNNGVDLMTPAPGATSLQNAITCLDMKAALEEFNTTAKTTYGYSNNANHPLYDKTLTNFLNHRFGRKFSAGEYLELMEGCAITDVVQIPRELAHARIDFYANVHATNFEKDVLAPVGTYKPVLFRYHPVPGTDPVVTLVDLSPVAHKDLKAYNTAMAAPYMSTSSTLHYTESSGDNLLFTNMDCTFSAAQLPSGAIYSVSDVEVWENGEFRAYKRHAFRLPASATTKDHADMQASVLAYLKGGSDADCNQFYAFWNKQLHRSEDYSNTLKTQYLTYMYGLSSTLSRPAQLAALAPGALPAVLTGFSGKTITYDDPYHIGARSHLYAYTPNPTGMTGYNLVKNTILPLAGGSGSKPFVDAPITWLPATPAPSDPYKHRLAVIRKANGDYWYRYFDNTDNKLYNLYVTPPAKSLGRDAKDYAITDVTMGPDPRTVLITLYAAPVAASGSGSTYKPALPAVTTTSIGHASFELASSSSFVRNVILDRSPKGVRSFDSLDCERDLLTNAILNGKAAYYLYFDSAVTDISKRYMNHLLSTTEESLTYCGRQQQYQQTLYYYDRVGNLVRTVPPMGIVPLTGTAFEDVDKYRDGRKTYNPESITYEDADDGRGPQPVLHFDNYKLTNHNKISYYRYNSLNQLVWQKTPDGGVTSFFYDAAGRQVFSQNSEQRLKGMYAYSLYDAQGRPEESGLIKLAEGFSASDAYSDEKPYNYTYKDRLGTTKTDKALHPDFIQYSYDEVTYPYEKIKEFIRVKARNEVVLTNYDLATTDLGALSGEMLSTQENLRNRVAAIRYYPNLSPTWDSPDPGTPRFATYYSYDLTGNVKTITYEFTDLKDTYADRFKRIDYDYDLASGKVNMISYNRGHLDQFYQQYDYDADNRITQVNTSNDGIIWNKDARYEYYKHGPLATLKLGEQQVQSLEYAYTIQGWLKAINGDALNPSKDMGSNGLSGDHTYPADVVAHALRYFDKDYKPIATAVTNHTDMSAAKDLYNGNISQQTTGISGLGTMQRVYDYDQLQRLKLATNRHMDDNALMPAAVTPAALYKSSYSYDMDGNITNLQRWDGNTTSPVQIDNFTYQYESVAANNNKLLKVADAAATTTGSDLQPGQPDENYRYDRIGELTRDKQGAEHITWDRFGKVLSIIDTASKRSIYFAYDGKGNRIWKDVVTPAAGGKDEHMGEYYVRDAGGNILSVYRTHSVYDRRVALTAITATASATSSPLGGGGTVLTDVLSGYTSTGLFTALSGVLTAGHSGWVTSYTDLPVHFYWSADPTLRSNLLYTGEDWIDAMRDEAPAVHLDALLSAGRDAEPLIASAVSLPMEGHKLIQYYSTHMPPADCQPVWALGSAMYMPGAHVANSNTLFNVINGPMGPAIISEMVGRLADNYTSSGTQAYNFYDAVMHDNGLWQSTNLRAQNGPWTDGIRQIVNRYADDGALSGFFDSWSGGVDALNAAVTSDYKLTAVYDHNPSGTLRDMVTEASASEIGDVLASMSELSVFGFGADVIAGGADRETVQSTYYYASSGDTMSLAEHHLYGSARLGVQRYDSVSIANIIHLPEADAANYRTSLRYKAPWYSYSFADVIDSNARTPYAPYLRGNSYWHKLELNRTLGRREYELTDHLGNVLATVLDRKTGVTVGEAPTLYDHWAADIASSADYYPGGMMMPGRYYEHDWSRMGAQGSPKDDEVYGKGSLIDMGDRHLDSRILRTPKTDALASKYPSMTPYGYVGGMLTIANDPSGKEIWIASTTGNGGKVQMYRYSNGKLYAKNGKEYYPMDIYVLKTYQDLKKIANSGDETLTNRLNKLDQSKKKHIIKPVEHTSVGNSNTVDSKYNEEHGVPTGTTTEYDPFNNETVNGDKREPIDALGHELFGHGFDADQGTADFSQTENGIEMNEVNAVKIENRVRSVITNEPERTEYGGKEIPKKLLKNKPNGESNKGKR